MAMIKMVPLEEEIKNNPELRIEDIKTLRDWYDQQPHLPKISDKELSLFLHSNYYRLEPTKTTIDSYFTIRTRVPEFFSNRDSIEGEDFKQSATVVTGFPLAGKTKEGYDIIFGKLIDCDPARYDYVSTVKYYQMLIDYHLYTMPLSKGHVFVFDMDGVTFGHARKANISAMKKFLAYFQEAMPIRLKGMHYVNTSAVMNFVLAIMRPFMNKDLLELLHLHTSLDSFSKFVDIDILPNEYGGKAGPLMTLHEETVKNLQDNRAWFLYDQENNRVNEAARPGKPKKSEKDQPKVEEKLKKLEID